MVKTRYVGIKLFCFILHLIPHQHWQYDHLSWHSIHERIIIMLWLLKMGLCDNKDNLNEACRDRGASILLCSLMCLGSRHIRQVSSNIALDWLILWELSLVDGNRLKGCRMYTFVYDVCMLASMCLTTFIDKNSQYCFRMAT